MCKKRKTLIERNVIEKRGVYVVWDNRELIEDSDFPAAVYEVLKYLVSEKSFEDFIVFERPKTRHKKDVETNLQGLEWAAKNRSFWFMGPIHWIRFDRKTGSLEGSLFTREGLMIFKTLGKISEVETMLPLLEQQGLGFDFQEVGTFTVEISVWDNKPFSLQNVRGFLAKLEGLLKRRKPRPLR